MGLNTPFLKGYTMEYFIACVITLCVIGTCAGLMVWFFDDTPPRPKKKGVTCYKS